MNDELLPAATPAPRTAEARKWVTLVYALYAASLLVAVTLPIGVVFAYIKRDDVAGSWLQSHVRWQIRTFWISLAIGVAVFVLSFVLIGFLLAPVAFVWFVYRVAKGWIRLSEQRPMYDDARPLPLLDA